ncbi:RbsD/FucU domain-containing protein [Mesorhizobium sp. M00.F.Ca.ET.216.01.1.1]|uniref:RbsD/FucU family protein n=1 Tax=Mesorhizobium sp. M00.F.Ca.ET.216.01.1.1 TaxID=2500528 RepID=UPI000FD90A81|nr:RbsD/FucU domain-containing protein [Mesorhizobium sp. M00.F.Ca.ET.216.01.1.1]TGQ46864.1 transporter [Mesorhizobium sp. M00.F.Ca.ET.216.01.1.1]TJW12682.1 MAG: transporter [Mesorhizobium sp.]TJW43735.1 MAG: transporter [Mesorhizobium sp.]
MLIGIPALLGPELLATLRAMGHGDEIALVDGNYPAEEQANRLVRADGHQLIPVLDAILSVLPVDDAVPEALFRASVKGDPLLADPVHREIEAICAMRAPGRKVVALAGTDFYARVKAAHAIVATSEPRLYANIIIRKGVIYPPESKNS